MEPSTTPLLRRRRSRPWAWDRDPAEAVTIFAAMPVQRIFIPLNHQGVHGFLGVEDPGPWPWRYITFTSSNSLGLNFL